MKHPVNRFDHLATLLPPSTRADDSSGRFPPPLPPLPSVSCGQKPRLLYRNQTRKKLHCPQQPAHEDRGDQKRNLTLSHCYNWSSIFQRLSGISAAAGLIGRTDLQRLKFKKLHFLTEQYINCVFLPSAKSEAVRRRPWKHVLTPPLNPDFFWKCFHDTKFNMILHEWRWFYLNITLFDMNDKILNEWHDLTWMTWLDMNDIIWHEWHDLTWMTWMTWFDMNDMIWDDWYDLTW
jgi:hypothetical protein